MKAIRQPSAADMADTCERFDRRNYRPPWPRVVPAEVLPFARGVLLTGHEYITRFIDQLCEQAVSATNGNLCPIFGLA